MRQELLLREDSRILRILFSISFDRLVRLCAVRNSSRVTEINNVFVRQQFLTSSFTALRPPRPLSNTPIGLLSKTDSSKIDHTNAVIVSVIFVHSAEVSSALTQILYCVFLIVSYFQDQMPSCVYHWRTYFQQSSVEKHSVASSVKSPFRLVFDLRGQFVYHFSSDVKGGFETITSYFPNLRKKRRQTDFSEIS